MESLNNLCLFYKETRPYATYKVLQKLFQDINLLLFSRGGGRSIDVGLLGENGHKMVLVTGERFLLNEDILHLLWSTFYKALLSG